MGHREESREKYFPLSNSKVKPPGRSSDRDTWQTIFSHRRYGYALCLSAY
jgi:hypothetical protein